MEKFILIKDYVKKVRRFNLIGRTLEFNLKDVPEKEEPISWIKEAVGDVIKKATEFVSPEDQVAFNFGCKDFSRGDGWIRFRPAEEITLDDVWGVISSIYQSNSTCLNTETFYLGMTSVRMPKGKGRGKNYNSFEEECSKRQGIIAINNKDNLCLPRALVVAKACVDKDPDYVKVRKDIQKLQTNRAKQLVEETGVVVPEGGAGIFELQKFQDYMTPDFKIVVYKYGNKGRDIIFEGSQGSKSLNLIYHKGHYNVITSLTAAFCCDYYCEVCHFPYNTRDRHRCSRTCASCQQAPPCRAGIKVKCQDCLRTFRSQECYENHIKPNYLGKSSVCDYIRLCPDCLKTVIASREHICGEIYCKMCLEHKPEGHLCFMRLDRGKPKTKDVLYVFYDLETRQEKLLTDGSHEHETNLCAFKQCCDKCLQEPNLFFCQTCGFKNKVIKENVISQFMNHLLEMRKKFKDLVVLAHNGQAFDHQFILNHMLTTTDLAPELIMRGSKIILMQLGNIRFLDSINYFPMALSALPKAFGLGDNFKKGYFPHLFNTIENENYIGPLPAIEYYSPDTMKEENRKSFLEWHEKHKNLDFDFQKEIEEYCVSDVEILTAACLKFREQMITATNVCPFTEASTIASACNKVYRRNFLKPNTIGIIPKRGYRLSDNQSKIALQWLGGAGKEFGVNIQYSAKGKEVILQGLKVDGYCHETKQVFEFHGCYWHGCPTCFKFHRDDPLPDNPSETLNYRHESTIARTERLKAHGYDVIEKWECHFRRELKEHPDKQTMLSQLPLNPRDAFYGGRTGNCMTYYKAQQGEKIKYLDVCSLYPWVCKYGKFPVGHPQVFIDEECATLDLKETDGLIKCKILPPSDLYHPVLPTKMNNKLMFVLCNKCGEQMTQDECTHSEEERALTGTWVIDEVIKALEKGYRILDKYEIWKYQVEQYNMDKKTGGLFTEMMNKFLKIKQEASGWPVKCITDVEKNTYIDEFFEREGIKLEFQAILNNPGLRCLAKLMLNSFWGKLGQRENQPKTKIVNKPEEFFSMLTNPSLEVHSALPINEDVLVVNYKHREETYDSLSTVNVCLAAYTTAQARLKLYSFLEQLEERVLYYDTDSVIFVHKDGQFEPSTGEFIGDMTDELGGYGVGSYIIEFVSGGPKNYSYKFYSAADKEEKILCKVKGISLDYAASQLVNFESIKDMILNPSSDPVKIVSKNFRRTKDHTVVTKEQTKTYKPNSKKRKFFADHTSVPYGYKKQKID